MELSSLPTEFAPAERARTEDVERQARMFKEEALLPLLLDAVPNVFLV
jgi:hypothetical protein